MTMPATATEMRDPFGDAIVQLLQEKPNPFFVQVGGFDGETFDPVRRHIVAHNLSGLIVEPIPQYFEKLKSLYAGSTNVTPVQCAIAEENGERTIWRFNPNAIAHGKLPPHFAGIISFVMSDLLSDTGVLAASSPDEETRAVLRSQLRSEIVPCRTMDCLLKDYGVQTVDMLQIDTEGYDYKILQMFDFARFRPAIVHYEHQHLKEDDRNSAEALLRSHGYRVCRDTYDTLALHGAPESTGKYKMAELRNLASSLLMAGRTKDSLMLLEHLESLCPDDADTLHQLARAFGADGQILKALEKLFALRAVTWDNKTLVAEIRAQMPAVMTRYNGLLESGNFDDAEKYIAALAALIPGNPAVLKSALHCNISLGRAEAARKYAAALLVVERDNPIAKAVLTEVRH